MRSALVSAAAGVFMLGIAPQAHAQEFSIIPDSTVIGRNWGYPTGTPHPRNTENPTGETRVDNLDVVFESVIFLKNLELTGYDTSTGIDGETFFGFLAPLRLRYRAGERVTIEAGAVLGQNFGDEDELDIAEPLLRIVYEPTENVFLVGGTILPTHPIHDALLDDLHVFRETEQGLQVRVDLENWKNDTWINWRIREDELTAEEFEVGNASQLRYAGFHADAQLLWYHVGGQQNSADRVENRVAGLIGASFGLMGSTIFEDRPKWLEDVRVGGAILASHDDTLAEETGSGWEVSAHIDTRPAEFVMVRGFASHFSGSDFSGARGDPLYQFDDYTQGGVTAFWTPGEGFRIETTAVLQHAESELNYTFAVNLVWGRAFTVFTPGAATN
ncbi:MAG: hypothetical protein SFY69_00235 [Planctomycetota bacterium]|nr:hypothetical protein [Planctomycetota bacterium]